MNQKEYIASENEINISLLIVLLLRRRRKISVIALSFGLFALAASFIIPPTFESKAVIMPPQQQSSGLAAALGNLGALAGAAGSIAGLKNPNDLYVGMLQSQTVADRIIHAYNLKQRYDKDTLLETREVLAKYSNLLSGKDGLISIEVEDEDPEFAALLANAYVKELAYLTHKLAVTDAAKRRLFFEQQLKTTKASLSSSENVLKQVQESTGLLEPEVQVGTIIGNIASLKAQIAANEVQSAGMASFATKNNPEYRRLQQTTDAMRKQLERLESQNPERSLALGSAKLPDSGLAYMRALREVKYQEMLFELLAKQYELAKVDEAKDSSIIQVLDVAKPADKKSKPSHIISALLGLVFGFFAACGQVIISASMKNGTLSDLKNKLQRSN